MELQGEGDRSPQEVSECSKADNEHRNLCRQSVRPLKMLIVVSAHIFRSYHLNSSSTESTLLVSDVAENVQDLEERLASMRLEMEDIRAAQLPAAPPLVDIESTALRTDYNSLCGISWAIQDPTAQ